MGEGKNLSEWKLRRDRNLSDLQAVIEETLPPPKYHKHTRTRAIESLLQHNYEAEGYLLCEGMIGCSKRWGRDLSITQYRNQLTKHCIDTGYHSAAEDRMNYPTNTNGRFFIK